MKIIKLYIYLAALPFISLGQDYDDDYQSLKYDENVRCDTLENGLTYYIRSNDNPEGKVELRLVVKAGSIQEAEDQQGLAHFMEHMCFNGTERYPKNTLVDYLQGIGVKFGQHLNAYTSFDETVYYLPVPTDDEENINKGFEILEDWAFNVVLAPEEIDKERGVVLEEYRTGLGADQRMMSDYLPVLLNNSRYAERLPIGKKDIIENFTYDKLSSFYNDWYRPNLMSVIVVGDIDLDKAEYKIKKHFSEYENPLNEKKRKKYKLDEHEQNFVSIVSDPEAIQNTVNIIYKDSERSNPVATIGDLEENLHTNLISIMLNDRLSEKANEPNPPYNYVYSYYGRTLASNYNAFFSYATTSGDNQIDALEVMVYENERAKKFGFLDSELKRAKDQLTSQLESTFKERRNKKSSDYANQYQSHFLYGEPIMDSKYYYQVSNYLIPKISLQDVNSKVKELIRDDNTVVVLTGSSKYDSIQPSRNEVLALLDIEKDKLEPYKEADVATALILKSIDKGEILNTTLNEELGTTTFELSNGAKVTLLQNDFNEDEVLFKGISYGGTNLLRNESYNEIKWALDGLTDAGVAGVKKGELNKMMKSRKGSISSSIGRYSEYISGNTTPKNLEFYMELIHAYFTDLNYDEEAYKTYKDKELSKYSNVLESPVYFYSDKLRQLLYGHNERYKSMFPNADYFNNTSYKDAYEFYNKQFSNAGDFHFYFVGNVKLEEFKKLIKMYLASLPSKSFNDEIIDLGYRKKVEDTLVYVKKGLSPLSMTSIVMSGETEYDKKEELAMEALEEILKIKLLEKLREGESSIYSVNVSCEMGKEPYGSYDLRILFPSSPEKAEELSQKVLVELDEIIAKGPGKKDLNKFKESQNVEYREKFNENSFWLSHFESSYINQEDPSEILSYLNNISALTKKDIKKVAEKYLSSDRLVFILLPEEK